MDDLLEAAAITGHKPILGCLEKIFIDLKVNDLERLENLPMLRNGRTQICGDTNVYRLIADIRAGLLIILENSQVIDESLSFGDEEE